MDERLLETHSSPPQCHKLAFERNFGTKMFCNENSIFCSYSGDTASLGCELKPLKRSCFVLAMQKSIHWCLQVMYRSFIRTYFT